MKTQEIVKIGFPFWILRTFFLFFAVSASFWVAVAEDHRQNDKPCTADPNPVD